MGFILIVIAVALGIALAPFILPLLLGAGTLAVFVVGAVLAVLLVFAVIGLVIGNFGEILYGFLIVLPWVAIGLVVYAGWNWGVDNSDRALHKLLPKSSIRRKARYVAIGASLTSLLVPGSLMPIPFLAYSTFAGITFNQAGLQWQETLALIVRVLLTSWLLVFGIVLVLAIVTGVTVPRLLELFGLWRDASLIEGGYNYPFFRDFIIPWDWPFSPIRR
jgi:hypothetical protein